MSNRFTEKAELALNSSVHIAESFGHTYVGTEHILVALLEDSSSCASAILTRCGVKPTLLRKSITEYSGIGFRSTLSSKDTTPRLRRVVENSYKYSQKYASNKIGTEHILIAILDERDSIAVKLLKYLNTDLGRMREELTAFLKITEQENVSQTEDQTIQNLLKFGKNLCAEYKRNALDPLIGREKEIERVIRVLCRKSKNNPCLVGEAGVGKTAIVEGIAAKISKNEVPKQLSNKKIILLSLTSMVAGAKYRGDFEDRIKNAIDEATKNPSVILFIDEIHTIVGAGAAEGAIDAANILKPYLARGDLRLIGATTPDEYKKYIEKDSALERRFQPVYVKEPSVGECIEMLIGLKSRFTKHYDVEISDDAIRKCVIWSNRYLKDRRLPDKAIDILDEALSQTIINSAEAFLSDSNNNIGQKHTLEESTIAMIVKEMCGTDPREFINGVGTEDLEDKLGSIVFGQEEAISGVCRAVIRSMAGISPDNKPRGVFLFLGDSGTGKTELAKALAQALDHDSNSLLRFDMTEFSESHSVSKFIGSPPGFVGYDESRSVCERVRRTRPSVLLLDEIEKCHRDIMNLLLQIFDEGEIADASGRPISFSDLYIIMTSNVGADKFKSESKPGFLSNENNFTITDNLSKYFPVEFINRVDDIILFSPLKRDTLMKIANKQLDSLTKILSSRDISLSIDDAVPRELTLEKYSGGARGIIHRIKKEIETPIAELIVSGDVDVGSSIQVILDKGVIRALPIRSYTASANQK